MNNLFHDLYNKITLNEGALQLEFSIWKDIYNYYKDSLNKFLEQQRKRTSSESFKPTYINLNFKNTKWEDLQPISRPIKVVLNNSNNSHHSDRGEVYLSFNNPIREVIDVIEHEVAHEIQYLLGIKASNFSKNKNEHKRIDYAGLSKIKYSDPNYDIQGNIKTYYPIFDNYKIYFVKGKNKIARLNIKANSEKLAFFKLKRFLSDKIQVTLINNKIKEFSRDDVIHVNPFNKLQTKPARKLTTNDTVNGIKIKDIKSIPSDIQLYRKNKNYYIYKTDSNLNNYSNLNISNKDFISKFNTHGYFEQEFNSKRTLHGYRPIEFQTDLLTLLRHIQYQYLNLFLSNNKNSKSKEELLKDKELKKSFLQDILSGKITDRYITYWWDNRKNKENIRKPYIKELYKNFVEIDFPATTYDNVQEIKKIIQNNKEIQQQKDKEQQELLKQKQIKQNSPFPIEDFEGDPIYEEFLDLYDSLVTDVSGEDNFAMAQNFISIIGIKLFETKYGDEMFKLKVNYNNFKKLGLIISNFKNKKYNSFNITTDHGDVPSYIFYTICGYNLFNLMLFNTKIPQDKWDDIFKFFTNININDYKQYIHDEE